MARSPARVPASEEKPRRAWRRPPWRRHEATGVNMPDAGASRLDHCMEGMPRTPATTQGQPRLRHDARRRSPRPEGLAGTYGGAHAGADTQAGLGPGMVASATPPGATRRTAAPTPQGDAGWPARDGRPHSQSQVVGTAAVAGKDTQHDGLGAACPSKALAPEDRSARTEFGAEKGHAPFGRDDQLVE